MVDAVFLDMDGVILVGPGTDRRVYREAGARALEACGVEEPGQEALAVFGTSHSEALYRHWCDTLGIDADEVWAYREQFASELTNDRIEAGIRPVFHDVGAIDDIATECVVGIVSNNRQASAAFVAEYVFEEDLDFAIGREPTWEDWHARKPEPTFLHRAIEAEQSLDVGDEIYYVGDKQKDVVAASKAGVQAAYLERPHNHHKELTVEPDVRLSGLNELTALV